MRVNLLILCLCTLLFCPVTQASATNRGSNDNEALTKAKKIKVLQLNLWHGGTKVANSLNSITDIIDQLDPDIVLFCEIHNGNKYLEELKTSLNTKGKTYFGESLDTSVGILSKYELENPVAFKDPGLMVKASTTINNQRVAIYSVHYDYTHYECYMPRGYSGTTWKKLDAPITDVNYILESNRMSQRDEAVEIFIADANKEVQNGNLVIMGGDFNEPSHLDWQENTKNLWDHNGVVINWDCSVMLTQNNYRDTYREKYKDVVNYPGFTFPAGNRNVELKDLSWAPEADERDRIDFIYYYQDNNIKLLDSKIVGPEETICYGQIISKDSKDKFVTPKAVWPTDHKGNLATFSISQKK
ncbi:MAG: endonuclease/exonuclease/phosphatase family protein [Dysgonomonas sp.]|nr:endonuclease/exonuclease/phosphatase family protein [Dysgonomonas sp.]